MGRVIKGIGKGSLFGYGRFMGVHSPFDKAIKKAKDPYINSMTLSRLYHSTDINIRNSVIENLRGRIEAGSIDLPTLSRLYKIDRTTAIDALIKSPALDPKKWYELYDNSSPREKKGLGPIYSALCRFINNVSPEEMSQLVKGNNPAIWWALASNSRTPEDILEKLLNKSCGNIGEYLRDLLKKNRKESLYDIYMQYNNKTQEWEVSNNQEDRDCKEALISLLSHYRDPILTTILANDPKTPKKMLVELAAAGHIGIGGLWWAPTFSVELDAYRNLSARKLLAPEDIITITKYNDDFLRNYYKIFNEILLSASKILLLHLSLKGDEYFCIDFEQHKDIDIHIDIGWEAFRRLDIGALNAEEMAALVNTKSERVLQEVIKHPNTPRKALLERVMNYKNPELAINAYSALEDSLTPEELSMLLYKGTCNRNVVELIFQHPKMPKTILLKEAMSLIGLAAYKCIENILTPEDLLELSKSDDDRVVMQVIRHPKMTNMILAKMSNKYMQYKSGALKALFDRLDEIKDSLNPDELLVISESGGYDSSLIVARHPFTPRSALLNLAMKYFPPIGVDTPLDNDPADLLADEIFARLDRQKLTADELLMLSGSGNYQIAIKVAHHQNTPREALIKCAMGCLASDMAYDRLEKSLTPGELSRLADSKIELLKSTGSKNDYVISRVIQHTNTTRVVLLKLAMVNIDPAKHSFRRLIETELTADELDQLTKSESEYVRRKVNIMSIVPLIAQQTGNDGALAKVRSFVISLDDEGGEKAISCLKTLMYSGDLKKLGLEGLERLKQISGGRVNGLLDALVVLGKKGMLDFLRTDPESFGTEKRVIQGNFNGKNPIHLLLNYFEVIKLTKGTSEKEPGFDEYLAMVEEGEKGQVPRKDVPKDLRLQVRGVAYEGYLLRKKILEIEKQAKEIGRSVIVVANLSYGRVALSPITEKRPGKKVIAGTNIPIISTKVGSTECHENEYVLNHNLFNASAIDYILRENPIVLVVDASTSVSDPSRTSPHIPDAFKGYRNYFMAVNEAVLGKVEPESFGEGTFFLRKLELSDEFRKTVDILTKRGVKPKRPQPYSLNFWYPGNKMLYLRAGKRKVKQAAKLDDASKIQGPAVLFMQSGIEPNAVPENIKKSFLYGKHHLPAFFDDKDNFRQFHFDYRKGYGIVQSRKFASLAQFYFKELINILGDKIPPKEISPLNLIKIKSIIADLDGVLALTDEPLSSTILSGLIDFLKKGGKLYLATEDIETNVEKRVAHPLPAELRKNLIIFSDGATKAFTFDNSGVKQPINEYSSKSMIDKAMRQNICNILNADLAGQFEFDARPDRISPDVRIDLRNVKKPRNDFIDKLRSLLSQACIKAKVYKAGRTSVKIVLQHKDDAVRYLVQKGMINPSATIVLGDNARQNQMDRGLLTALPEAISINIGHRSSSIEKENPNAVQLDDEGINATLNILAAINKYGGVDKDNLNR
jgi:hypothetical protein